MIDASVLGSRSRYINHSCDPNCYAVATLPEETTPSSGAASSGRRRDTDGNAGLRCPLHERLEDEWLTTMGTAAQWLTGSVATDNASVGTLAGAHSAPVTTADDQETPTADAAGRRPGSDGHGAAAAATVATRLAPTLSEQGAVQLLLSRHHSNLPSEINTRRRRVFVYAARLIRAGEELTYDYQFPMDERKVPCKCGSAACRGTINKEGA